MDPKSIKNRFKIRSKIQSDFAMVFGPFVINFGSILRTSNLQKWCSRVGAVLFLRKSRFLSQMRLWIDFSMILDGFGKHFGDHFGQKVSHLGFLWAPLGLPGPPLGLSWPSFGFPLAPLRPSWALLGPPLRSLWTPWAPLGLPLASLGLSLACLGSKKELKGKKCQDPYGSLTDLDMGGVKIHLEPGGS